MKEISVLPVFEKGKLSFSDIPLFEYSMPLSQRLAEGMSGDLAVRLLEAMLYVRKFEEIIIRMKSGTFTPHEGFKFVGATHLSIGQEAVAAGTMSALGPDDYITSTHRGHGHSICKVLFRLYGMDKKGLLDFLEKKEGGQSESELLDEAVDLHLFKTMAELFGKEEGYCHGRGGGMHIADFHSGHLGANAIVGGSFAIATGAALSSLLLSQKKVVACMVGDGAINNGICLESMNFASMPQFGTGFPAIYIIENNQYGMTGQQQGEVTNIRHLSQRGTGFNDKNMHARTECAMNVLSVHKAVEEASEICRKGEGPVLLEFKTYRYYGHSLSDKRVSYRVPEEFYNVAKDPDCLHNLIESPAHQKDIAALRAKLHIWMQETEDPMLEAFLHRTDRTAVDAAMLKTYGPLKKKAKTKAKNRPRKRKKAGTP